jgi:hypothetical protein
MRARHHFLLLGIVGLAMSGCATDSNPQPKSNAKMFGLISGDLPPAKPFVVQARPTVEGTYPAVGVTPPGRPDRVLTPAERDALLRELQAASGQRPKKRPKPVS